MEQHLRNAAASTTLSPQLRYLWKSPRGTVLRMEAFSLVAIAFSFLLVAFGSCRRWSNRWIIQKGFLVANVLSLSLGTYSIGLMQSSPVKTELYPIWAVSLLALFGCVDPITSYVGTEYRGPLSKVLFQLCLYCGYVLLMSNSTFSRDIGNIAVSLLCAITFIKGFHRSMALVLQRTGATEFAGFRNFQMEELMDENENDVNCAFYLSRKLKERFLGEPRPELLSISISRYEFNSYVRFMKLIEIELAFLYDEFFTSNFFLHGLQAKMASLWVFASFIAICFVGVVVAVPGTMSSRRPTSPVLGAGTIVVDTTTADLVISLVVLGSLALLQLVQLIRCWTSIWARPRFDECKEGFIVLSWSNLFGNYFWQNKLGQHLLTERRFNLFMRIFVHFCYILGLEYIVQLIWDLLGSNRSNRSAVWCDNHVKASVIDFLCQLKSHTIDEDWYSFMVEIESGADKSGPYYTTPSVP